MHAMIEIVLRQDNPVWLVHAYGFTLNFPDQKSSTTRASKPEERVNAPHILPQGTLRHWAAVSARDRSTL